MSTTISLSLVTMLLLTLTLALATSVCVPANVSRAARSVRDSRHSTDGRRWYREVRRDVWPCFGERKRRCRDWRILMFGLLGKKGLCAHPPEQQRGHEILRTCHVPRGRAAY